MFGLISINYLFGFNIKDNGIRYYNFDIIPCFELLILLLLRESHITTQLWNLVCLPHIMVFVYIFVVYINFECVCIYNYGEISEFLNQSCICNARLWYISTPYVLLCVSNPKLLFTLNYYFVYAFLHYYYYYLFICINSY